MIIKSLLLILLIFWHLSCQSTGSSKTQTTNSVDNNILVEQTDISGVRIFKNEKDNKFKELKHIQWIKSIDDDTPTYCDGPAEFKIYFKGSSIGEDLIIYEKANVENSTKNNLKFEYCKIKIKVIKGDGASKAKTEIVVYPGENELIISKGEEFYLVIYGSDHGRGEQHFKMTLQKKEIAMELIHIFYWHLLKSDFIIK